MENWKYDNEESKTTLIHRMMDNTKNCSIEEGFNENLQLLEVYLRDPNG